MLSPPHYNSLCRLAGLLITSLHSTASQHKLEPEITNHRPNTGHQVGEEHEDKTGGKQVVVTVIVEAVGAVGVRADIESVKTGFEHRAELTWHPLNNNTGQETLNKRQT